MDFTGKVVVITGAGGGIGSAVAKKFAVLGARLALVSTRVETADRTAKSLSLPEDRVFCVGADLTDETAAHTAVAAIMGHYGRIDALVNTAGIPDRAKVYDSACIIRNVPNTLTRCCLSCRPSAAALS